MRVFQFPQMVVLYFFAHHLCAGQQQAPGHASTQAACTHVSCLFLLTVMCKYKTSVLVQVHAL